MRTTVDLPDDLLQTVKSRAALEGLDVVGFIERALRAALVESISRGAGRVSFPLHKSAAPGTLTASVVRAIEDASVTEEDSTVARSL